MISDNKTLDKVYTASTKEELMDAYKEWAGNYEKDTVDAFGYVAHQIGAQTLHNHLAEDAPRILDAGCGTGLVGQVLAELGYEELHALDYSAEMLGEAKKKGVYKQMMQADLSRPLALESNTYDAAVCVGTFTYGHVEPSGLDELARVIRPGGIFTVTIREGAYDDHGYPAKMEQMEADGVWKRLDVSDQDYLKNEGVHCKVCTFEIL